MSSQLLGALLAAGLGYWAYTDAKGLAERGIKVWRFSPVAWGFAVALVAIVFGILYIVQRRVALQPETSFPAPSHESRWPEPPPLAPPPPAPPAQSTPSGQPSQPAQSGTTGGAPRERERFCSSCGHELPAYVSSFCPKCGTQLLSGGITER